MSEASQFLVMVDMQLTRPDLMRLIREKFPEAVARKENSYDIKSNWLEIWANDDADSRLAEDPEEGYLYYRWRVEVTPINKSVDEAHQIELARCLQAAFEEAGGKAVICASFEDKL